jgi:hypothetical protein
VSEHPTAAPGPRPAPSEPSALFHPDGDLFVPTVLAQGPWAVGAMHGGPAGALLAHLCQQADGGQPHPMRVARITVDLLRPIPLVPLRTEVRIARPGRRVDWVDASLFAGDAEVARAAALRLQHAPLEVPTGIDPSARGFSGDVTFDGRPDDGIGFIRVEDDFVPGFHSMSAELRFVRSLPTEAGPGQVWIRLRHPVIDGVATSPLMRTVAAADFGNAASSSMPVDTHGYINADLMVALWRDPATEWIGLDAVTRFDPALGCGLAEVALHDERGPIGRSHQTVLVAPRS